jgi:hypothetical protein
MEQRGRWIEKHWTTATALRIRRQLERRAWENAVHAWQNSALPIKPTRLDHFLLDPVVDHAVAYTKLNRFRGKRLTLGTPFSPIRPRRGNPLRLLDNGVRGRGVGAHRSFLFWGWHQPGFPTVFQPIARATDVDPRRVMQQPVRNRRCYDRVCKDRSPVFVSPVRGH